MNHFFFKFYEQSEDELEDFFDRLLCISTTVLEEYEIDNFNDDSGRRCSTVTVYFDTPEDVDEFKKDKRVQKLYGRYSCGDINLSIGPSGPKMKSDNDKTV